MGGTLNGGGALYMQIAALLEDQILRGILPEDEQAPSTNELSRQLCINPATAAKGLNMLVEEGVLYKKRGLGMFVAAGSRQRILDRRKERFYEGYVKRMAAEARSLGITREELAAMIERAAGGEKEETP